MSKESVSFRKQAAELLGKARKTRGPEREAAIKKADAYKALADNEEWLAGEPERSSLPLPRRKK
jgi:hypothetical protein